MTDQTPIPNISRLNKGVWLNNPGMSNPIVFGRKALTVWLLLVAGFHKKGTVFTQQLNWESVYATITMK